MQELQTLAQQYPGVIQFFFFGIGACLGSFFNVCIYRIPEERSIIFPRSQCGCGKSLPWFDNFPILSWLILRGKARCCGRKFSIRYPFVELLTALLFLYAWQLFGLQNPSLAFGTMLLCCCLIPSVFIDFDHMVIPDLFSVGGTVVGVLYSFWQPHLHGIEGAGIPACILGAKESILGVCIGSAFVYWIGVLGEAALRKEAMGEGDVKFIGCIGAFLGWQGAIFSLFGGACAGLILLIPFLLIQKLRSQKEATNPDPDAEPSPDTIGVGVHIPFGPMLALGALLYIFFFQEYTDAYFQNIWQILNEFANS